MSEPLGSEGTTRRLPVLDKDRTAEDDVPESVPDPAPETAPGSGRFWSARRVPAAVVALLLAALAGVLLYDIAAVRADRPPLRVRRELARQLAERPLDDVWVLVGAGVAAALGLWLILLAVTPGLRDVLPMRRPHPDVRAGLHRGAAGLVLRDRAMEVAGVQSVHVRAGRRRADVRAVSHFRDLDEVRADLDAVLGDAVRGLGLARPPALSVRVRRPGRKG
ncbi:MULTISPECIES: DUF6286 domain-containing protein [Streptomyces]|uniref:DUF6286 domain-containing protein n=1 Tax=Streptomyces bobili TaxID=67280 RepID=A0ABZ1R5X7_9ACTN|nr:MULTISPECIES: DUF6286 domain-containing protein [Streptomyces]QEU65178.1 hypothetical protein CP966_07780 [Streptomyces galilaeus]GGW29921.1 hypothetical protein GCM10010350_11890 [Streptomyces galilaeus]